MGVPRGPFSMDAEPPFQPRFPWWNGDLQTLRDTFRSDALPPDQGQRLPLDVGGGEQLLAKLDAPLSGAEPRGLVLLMHGLGGPPRPCINSTKPRGSAPELSLIHI